MKALPPPHRAWTREQWLFMFVFGGLVVLALGLLILDAARHPPAGESRLAPPPRHSPPLP